MSSSEPAFCLLNNGDSRNGSQATPAYSGGHAWSATEGTLPVPGRAVRPVARGGCSGTTRCAETLAPVSVDPLLRGLRFKALEPWHFHAFTPQAFVEHLLCARQDGRGGVGGEWVTVDVCGRQVDRCVYRQSCKGRASRETPGHPVRAHGGRAHLSRELWDRCFSEG